MRLGVRAALSLAVAGLALAGPAPEARADAASCRALSQRGLDAGTFALPTGGGRVDSAEFIAASGGLPAYCKVLGRVAPVDPKGFPVLFQVNLPDGWNRKAVQYGGGAFNGVLATGLGALPIEPPSVPVALARGFTTFGTDGGHPPNPDIRIFLLDEEAFADHAFGAYKKTRDAAGELMAAYYGQKPAHVYYVGLSEGGREGMLMAQRFPADYAGVAAVAPVIGLAGMMLADYSLWAPYRHGSVRFTPAQLALLQKMSDEACDHLDGLRDGVISRPASCVGKVNVARLQCADPQQSSDSCISAAQVRFLGQMRSDLKLDFPLANGITTYPGWGFGSEAQPVGFTPWRQPEVEAPRPNMARNLNGPDFMRYRITKDVNFAADNPFNLHRARIQAASAMADATDPDLSAFQGRGGKILIIENGADYAQSPTQIYNYQQAVTQKLGATKVRDFMRIYVNPGINHRGEGTAADGSALPDRLDMLGVLDSWVDRRQAPDVLTVASYTPAAPFQIVATKPLCQYPMYPRYKVGGDAKQAAAYICVR